MRKRSGGPDYAKPDSAAARRLSARRLLRMTGLTDDDLNSFGIENDDQHADAWQALASDALRATSDQVATARQDDARGDAT